MFALCRGDHLRKIAFWLLFGCVGFFVLGCAQPKSGMGGGGTYTPPPNYKYISGNWQFQASPTSGATPFTSLAGFIAEGGGQAGLSDSTTAALRVQSTSCYSTSVEIPLLGGTGATEVDLTSFPVDGQTLTLMATKDSTSTHLSGTYSVSGGCADGDKGTLTGTFYMPLTGIYAGSLGGNTPGQSMQLTLNQGGDGSGDGLSYLRGGAVFTGFPCFTTGTFPYANPGAFFPGYVVGNAISMNFTTSEAAGSNVVMTGVITPDGNTINVQSFAIEGGSCASPAAPVSLTLTKQ